MLKHRNFTLVTTLLAFALIKLTILTDCRPFFETPSAQSSDSNSSNGSNITKPDPASGIITGHSAVDVPGGEGPVDGSDDDYMVINEGEIVQRNDIMMLIASASKEELEEMLAQNPKMQEALVSKIRTAVQQRQDIAVQPNSQQEALYDIGQGQTHVQAPIKQVQQQQQPIGQAQLEEPIGQALGSNYQQANARPYVPSYQPGRPNPQGRPHGSSQPAGFNRGNWSEYSDYSSYNQNGAYYNPNSGPGRPNRPPMPRPPPGVGGGSWDEESWRLANIETSAAMKAYEKLRKRPSMLFLGKDLKKKWDAHKNKAKLKKDPLGGYPGVGYSGGGYPGDSYPGGGYPDGGYPGGYWSAGYPSGAGYPPGYFVGPGYVGSYSDGFVKKSDVSEADSATAKPAAR